MNSIETFVWAMFAAIMLAAIYSFAMQNSLALLAKRLMEKQITDKGNAVTLSDLGYKNIFVIAVTKYFASGKTVVARAVEKVYEEDKKKENKDLLFQEKPECRYYLPEENITKKVIKHINEKISYPKLALIIAILVVVALIASSVIKFLGNFAYGLVDGNGGNEPYGVQNGQGTLLEEQEELNRKEEEMKALEAEIEAAEKAKAEEKNNEATENSENSVVE